MEEKKEQKQAKPQGHRPEVKQVKEETRGIIRICGADMFGSRKIYNALRQIRGVGFQIANAVCGILNLDRNKLVADLSEAEIKSIETLIKNPIGKIPTWMFNRRKDYETGKDMHLIDAEVKFRKEFDIKRLKVIKSRRGIRHALSLPVRGQRTKAHFRHGTSIGVRKKSLQQTAAAPKDDKKKDKK